MKRAIIVMVALAAFVALPAAGWAQAKPDFSGSWTMDAAKSDPAPARGGGGGGGAAGAGGGAAGAGGGGARGGGRGGGGGVPMAMTIKQTPAALTIESMAGPNTQTLTYKLDGTESVNTMGPAQAKSKAVWDGAKLTITTTQDFNGNTVETKDVYSMDGANLVRENTRTGPNGPMTRKVVYTKG
jgi:hypothetical protein